MLKRVSVGFFVVSSLAVAVTALEFREMRLWVGALLLIAVLQIGALLSAALVAAALPLARLVGALSIGAVLLTLLMGTIGGTFHIDQPIQPVLWSLAALGVSCVLLHFGSRSETRRAKSPT